MSLGNLECLAALRISFCGILILVQMFLLENDINYGGTLFELFKRMKYRS